jgi:transposase-like protein
MKRKNLKCPNCGSRRLRKGVIERYSPEYGNENNFYCLDCKDHFLIQYTEISIKNYNIKKIRKYIEL